MLLINIKYIYIYIKPWSSVAQKTELTLPVFQIWAVLRLPVFVCPITASSCVNYVFGVSSQSPDFSPHPVFVCPLRTPQTAHPTPPRNLRAHCSRSSPRLFRRDTGACWLIAKIPTTPTGSQTTTSWTRWDMVFFVGSSLMDPKTPLLKPFFRSIWRFRHCLGFPVMSPSRKTRKSSESTLESAAGSEPLSDTMDASQIAPGSRAMRTTATPPCVTSLLKRSTLSPTSTFTRHRSTTTPIRWHRPCRLQTLTPPLDPWLVRATAAHTASASLLWSPPSPAPPHRPMGGKGGRRTGLSGLTASTAARPFTSLITGEAGARMLRIPYRRASGRSAACGWQTPCCTTACQTLRGTIQTPAPVTEARAAGEADSVHAGWLCSVYPWWLPASASTHLSTPATGQGSGVAAAGADTRPWAERLHLETSRKEEGT